MAYTNGRKVFTIIRTTGSEGSIEIPPITNVVLTSKGILSWDALDISMLDVYNPSVSYAVTVNGKEYETNEPSINIYGYLENGTNNITVTAKIVLRSSQDKTVEFTKTMEITVLTATLPSARYGTSAAAVGTNVYMFGGVSDNGTSDEILKYDTLTDTITTLSAKLPSARSGVNAVAVGTDIYIFNGENNNSSYITEILKFDTTTDTITTLEATADGKKNAAATVVGTDIYIFGGAEGTYSTTTNKIRKIDTINQTYETLGASITLNQPVRKTSVAAVGTDIYIFGGSSWDDKIMYNFVDKFDTLTKKVTHLDITLPKKMCGASAVAIADCIYIFGGFDSDGYFLDTIIKFDPITLTIETLGLTLPSPRNYTTSVAVANSAYIFGGRYANDYINEILKFTT